jgi:F-type H+-transporting ATPase subunit epsilon
MATLSDAKTFHCEIVAPDRKVFSGDIEFGVFPGTEGEFGILPRHAPLLSKLDAGIIKIVQKGVPTSYATAGGFLDVNNNRVTVVAEVCEASGDINKEAALADEKEAEGVIAANKSTADVTAARHKLKHALARLQVSAGVHSTHESSH